LFEFSAKARANVEAAAAERRLQGVAAICGEHSAPGHPLQASERAFFEPRFGCDLSFVRIHSDEGAARSARALGAPAYAIGRQIFLGAGGSDAAPRRRALLAHELSHALQQRSAEGHDVRPTPAMRRSSTKEENEAELAAGAVLGGYTPTLTPAHLAIACAPDDAEKLHDDEQLGDAIAAFNKKNSDLGADVLGKIRSGIVQVTYRAKSYEVAHAFFDFYSSLGNSLRQMTTDEETKARKSDRLAETSPGVMFTTTTLRPDVLSYGALQLADLLLHEFAHVHDSPGDVAGGGTYQEGHAYGVEYFYASIAGDSARMTKIVEIVTAGEVLGYSKAYALATFQEDFKVTIALLTALKEIVAKGSSTGLPFPELTSDRAQYLEKQVVESYQNSKSELAKYIAHVKAHFGEYNLPPI
jgi:hypothetical protein